MPPTVSRQRPSQPAPPPKKSGSVLDEAVDVGTLEDESIKIVLYGQNRVGKTTLACQFTKPLLLIGMEPNKTGGAKSVTGVPGVKFLRVQTTEKAKQLAAELREANPFKTVVVDSVTSYQDIWLKEILGLEAVPEQGTYGISRDVYRVRSEKTREGLRPFLALDCHVVLTAKEKDHNPPKDDKPGIVRGMQHESFFAADLGGATVGWLHDACDYICQMYLCKETEKKERSFGKKGTPGYKVWFDDVETGRVVRRLRTMYHPNYAAGMRSAHPDKVPEFIQDPSYAKILEVIRGTGE